MNRWKASAIHLLISCMVVGTVAAYIIYFWYPPALVSMAKADKLLMLMGGIDLVIGPLLTLIVYKTGKPSLRMDLTVIGVIQTVFLSIGLYTMFESRPVFLVASATRFDLVFAPDISPYRLAEARMPEYRRFSIAKPQLVGAEMPLDERERDRIIASALAGGGDLQTMPAYYVPYQEVVADLLANALALKATPKTSEQAVSIMVEAAKAYGRKPEEVRYMRLGSSRGFAVMLIDAKTAEIVGPVNVDP